MLEPRKQKRIAIYVPEEDYKELKSVLALKGITVSGWFRQQVSEIIKNITK
jgi:hypothetical protein